MHLHIYTHMCMCIHTHTCIHIQICRHTHTTESWGHWNSLLENPIAIIQRWFQEGMVGHTFSGFNLKGQYLGSLLLPKWSPSFWHIFIPDFFLNTGLEFWIQYCHYLKSRTSFSNVEHCLLTVCRCRNTMSVGYMLHALIPFWAMC